MPQRISISRWNIGEASRRSIGDYDQPIYTASCRILTNFVPSETGKLWRRPGFEHHLTLSDAKYNNQLRLVPYYRRADTLMLLFYLTGDSPDEVLTFDLFQMDADGIYQFYDTYPVYDFKIEDFQDDRPTEVDLRKLSWVQVEEYIYLTHPNMEDPYELGYVAEVLAPDPDPAPMTFVISNYSESDTSYYLDMQYVEAVGDEPAKWTRSMETDFNAGGGSTATVDVDAGWTTYTGNIFDGANQGLGANGTPPQHFKYLTCVTFAFERLVFAQGPRVFGSIAEDVLGIGRQVNGDTPKAIEVEPVSIIASDPFLYRAASDLGYEEFYWLVGGQLLMGGANNGAWVLSNREIGGIDTTSPLMYKATTNGAYWVQGKTIGDAMLYFQRPGRQLNEFLYSNASKNYVAANMSEYSDHIFYDSPPIEMQVQRSPFNVNWMLREDGELVSFTYERYREVYAWARHPFGNQIQFQDGADPETFAVITNDATSAGGKVITMAIQSDGLYDRVAIVAERENGNGTYRTLELMGEYTPESIEEVFVDAAVRENLPKGFQITSIAPDYVDGHILSYDPLTSDEPAVDMVINFNLAYRTDDPVGPIIDNTYDYIYGEWTVTEVDTVANTFRMESSTGLMYMGIYEASPPATEYAYTSFGVARAVLDQPEAGSIRYEHLAGIFCNALMDGNPKDIYITLDGSTFYNSAIIPDDWDGDETSLEPYMLNEVFYNSLIIGRPYQSVFSPFVMKKSINHGKINKIELEVFRSLGGRVGTASSDYDDRIEVIKMIDLTYPARVDLDQLYDGTLIPPIVGGFGKDPFFFVICDDAVPFNITNVIYTLEAN